jgi:hypothetical protein
MLTGLHPALVTRTEVRGTARTTDVCFRLCLTGQSRRRGLNGRTGTGLVVLKGIKDVAFLSSWNVQMLWGEVKKIMEVQRFAANDKVDRSRGVNASSEKNSFLNVIGS